MDPKTVVLILALNLMVIGGLLAMIGRRMADPAGMRGFATGSIVFGLAYLLRLVQGHSETGVFSVVADAGMVFATLSYATGLRQFGGLSPLSWQAVWAWLAAFAAASLTATAVWQGVGRHAVLKLALAAAYLTLATLALAATRHTVGSERLPLRMLAGIVGVLGGLTALRGIAVPFVGVAPLFAGLPAQVYYGYSTIATVLMVPTLLWMIFLRLNDRLAQLATHDPLTGLLNRHGLDEALTRHFSHRPARSLVLMQLDIDHFKRINDGHGHAAGDAVLLAVARALLSQLRGGDFVARMGGEEFLVGCDSADCAQAQALAERLRQAVAACVPQVPGGSLPGCTVSIGLSPVFAERAGWEPALREADRALYAAKQGGRNRVVLAAGFGLSAGSAGRSGLAAALALGFGQGCARAVAPPAPGPGLKCPAAEPCAGHGCRR